MSPHRTHRTRLTLVAALAVLAIVAGTMVMVSCTGQPDPPPLSGPPTTSATAAPTPPLTTSPTAAPTTVPMTPPATTASPPAPRPPSTTSRPPTTTPALPGVPASLRGKDVEAIATSSRIVALTFDGGAIVAGLTSILSTLEDEGVTATFFLTGDFARNYPQAVAAIVAGGHRIGNHTVNHPHLPTLSDAQIVSQLRGTEVQIRAAGGTDPRPLFRFPFGDRDAHTIAVVNDAGYVAVRWTVDTLGWKGTKYGGITAQLVVDRVVNAARPGEIVLMHVGSNPDDHTTLDADALPMVIARLRDLGYRFVTLDALLA